MRMLTWMIVAGGLLALSTRALAEDEDRAPSSTIRVLENPYQIASFYRSNGGASRDFSDRYPIAAFYRQGNDSRPGYSRFWSAGCVDRPNPWRNCRRRSGGREMFLLGSAFDR